MSWDRFMPIRDNCGVPTRKAAAQGRLDAQAKRQLADPLLRGGCETSSAVITNRPNAANGLLPCGCEPTGTCVVRTYSDGRTEWGYACKCGKKFIKLGGWR
jgi:hypothetical protein